MFFLSPVATMISLVSLSVLRLSTLSSILLFLSIRAFGGKITPWSKLKPRGQQKEQRHPESQAREEMRAFPLTDSML